MQLVRHPRCCPESLHHSTLVLGNFDGVHVGHQAILEQAHAVANRDNTPLTVMTFEPHPREFFSRHSDPFRITPLRTKYARLKEANVDGLFVPRFNEALANLDAERFVHYLLDHIKPKHVFVGYDFKFGKGRTGDSELLKRMGTEQGFDVTVIDAQYASDGDICSSTRIRAHLQVGNMLQAHELLGWEWYIDERVKRGKQLGGAIGFPTINIPLIHLLRPKFGVYTATVTRAGDETIYRGVANVGNRPTVDGTTDMCEVHLFNVAQEWYGQRVQVTLREFIRPEQKFDSVDALKAQIERDVIDAKNRF